MLDHVSRLNASGDGVRRWGEGGEEDNWPCWEGWRGGEHSLGWRGEREGGGGGVRGGGWGGCVERRTDDKL